MSQQLKAVSNRGWVQTLVLWWMRIIVAGGVIWGAANLRWETFFISILALVLMLIPELVRRKYKLLIPIEYDVVIVAFIFAAVFLGEVGDAYELFWWWDAVLHMVSGVILAMGGLLILYTLKLEGKLRASPFIIAVFVFSFGVALGVLWEVFEYMVDSLFDTNMQKSGLQDTMWDLIVDGVGSFVVAWAGYAVIKHDDHRGIVGATLKSYVDLNPKLKRRRMITRHEKKR